jgi:glycine betaine/proline transport system ATP-binding protein
MRVIKRARATASAMDGGEPPSAGLRANNPNRGEPHSHSAAEPVIEMRGLWKVYGPQERKASSEIAQGAGWNKSAAALQDVSLQVHPGEIFVVVGLSGSGKTTLLRSINGLVRPTAGAVRVLGTDVAAGGTSLRELRSRVGMIFQLFGILPHRSVVSNAAFGLELRGVGRAERERRASETLSLVGLAGRERAYPDELSGGQLQRVGLARALALDPDVLLMDEPFSALDVLIREELRKQLLEIQARLKKTIVLITHDLTDAVVLADRIALLHDGCLR